MRGSRRFERIAFGRDEAHRLQTVLYSGFGFAHPSLGDAEPRKGAGQADDVVGGPERRDGLAVTLQRGSPLPEEEIEPCASSDGAAPGRAMAVAGRYFEGAR